MNKLLIIGIISLIIGIIGMPYGFYFILRTLICLTTAKYLYDKYQEKKYFDDFMFFLLGIAIIYNPILPLPLGKTLWTIVNIVTIITYIHIINKGNNE